jgi:hypothetical protein
LRLNADPERPELSWRLSLHDVWTTRPQHLIHIAKLISYQQRSCGGIPDHKEAWEIPFSKGITYDLKPDGRGMSWHIASHQVNQLLVEMITQGTYITHVKGMKG